VKTSILQLEPHDDVITVRDRLNWVKGGRALLIWPKRAPGLDRQVDLAILQHYATSLGLQLGIVSGDPEVRAHAEAVGIPIFKNIRQAQTERWAHRSKRVSRFPGSQPNLDEMRQAIRKPPRAWLTNPMVRGFLFTIAVLALLAIIVIIAPKANIILYPDQQTQTVMLTLSAAPETQNSIETIPVQPVSVIVEGQDTLTTTGTITVPVGFATGTVDFTNLSSDELRIPSGSVVRTAGENPIRFTTNRAVNLPSGPGTTGSAPVTALIAGSESNLPPGTINSLEGPFSFKVGVSNSKPTQNGTEIYVHAPTSEDRVMLFQQVLTELQAKADAALKESLSSDAVLIGSATLTDTIAQTYVPELDEPAVNISLTLRLQFDGWAVLGNHIEQQAITALDMDLPEGYAPVAGTMSIENISEPTLNADGTYRWQVKAQREILAEVSPMEAINRARWMSPPEAIKALSQLPLAVPAQIVLSPSWWPIVPWQVYIQMEEPADAHPGS